ncbi:nucleotidyltransferase family protein [Candidatus Kaiserbacteria bacterium]|nr:nucleotidyltransferase family protein [Candidatus Kaiserbacteria bacterium]
MQAVILAAGRGTRMEELTTAVPKPMLVVDSRTLLEHKLDALPEEIQEVVLIIGHLSDVIKKKYKGSYRGRALTYVEQGDLNGTAGALWAAKDVLSAGGGSASGGKDRFLVLNGDDIFDSEDLKQCAEESNSWKLLVQQMPEMHRAGAVQLDENANITAIIEGDLGTEPGLASTNMFALDTRLFSQPLVPKQEGSLEYGLPQTVIAAAKALGIRLEPIFTADWIQINAPGDLTKAAEILKKTKKS